MILPHRNSLVLGLLWAFFGLLMAAGLLLFQIGGYLFTVAVLLAVMVGLLISSIYGRAKAKRSAAQEQPQKSRASTVGVKVLRISGTCAGGVQYQPGTVYLFAAADAAPAMCGPAITAVQPVVQRVRLGQSTACVELQCPLSGAEISFEVSPLQLEDAHSAKPT